MTFKTYDAFWIHEQRMWNAGQPDLVGAPLLGVNGNKVVNFGFGHFANLILGLARKPDDHQAILEFIVQRVQRQDGTPLGAGERLHSYLMRSPDEMLLWIDRPEDLAAAQQIAHERLVTS